MSVMDTWSGRRFDPMEMTADDVSIEDIAHALSLLCRGGGHLRYFYSVGQHSINCMKEAKARRWSRRLQLACLLHDASEAYISDIIRPVKAHLPNYKEIENQIMAVIWQRYGLGDMTPEEHAAWRQIDDEIMDYELRAMMPGEENRPVKPFVSQPDLFERRYQDVEEEFLSLAAELTA